MKCPVVLVAITSLAGVSAAHAQFGSGIVYDPTQSAHALTQIENESSRFRMRPHRSKRERKSLPTP